MADPDQLPRDDVRSDASARPLTRAVERACSRPGCRAPARATLTFAYAHRQAWIEHLQDTDDPQAYDLCAAHAARTRPPHGWQLRDSRPEEDQRLDPPPVTPADLGGERTVAVLAAALRAVPDIAPERDDRLSRPPDDALRDAGVTAAGADQPELVAPAAGAIFDVSVAEHAASAALGTGPPARTARPPLAVRAASE